MGHNFILSRDYLSRNKTLWTCITSTCMSVFTSTFWSSI